MGVKYADESCKRKTGTLNIAWDRRTASCLCLVRVQSTQIWVGLH
jgi:hypothetical protein